MSTQNPVHGCLHAVRAKSLQSCPTLCNSMDCSPPSYSVHGGSPGKNTGVGCHALLQEIFPTWGLNLRLPASSALQTDSLPTESPGKPHGCLLQFYS